VRTLADYTIARDYPEVAGAADPYRALLEQVVIRQAELVAKWVLVGFIHGVMNTDNTAISGETIDYGPCAFMDAYDPATVFSSIDHAGRYAYGNQPRIAQWNLTRFAETLLPLLGEDQEAAIGSAQEALGVFGPRFQAAYEGGLGRKLGLATRREGDRALAQDLLKLMAENAADFTLTFRLLGGAVAGPEDGAPARALFADGGAFDAWAERWRQRLAEEPGEAEALRAAMRTVNPLYIPRNHRVEEALAAADNRDFGPFETLLDVVSHPFDELPGLARFAEPAGPDQKVYKTFCGT
jgi:uncharacterized protein YdiU (UPF0061 family)